MNVWLLLMQDCIWIFFFFFSIFSLPLSEQIFLCKSWKHFKFLRIQSKYFFSFFFCKMQEFPPEALILEIKLSRQERKRFLVIYVTSATVFFFVCFFSLDLVSNTKCVFLPFLISHQRCVRNFSVQAGIKSLLFSWHSNVTVDSEAPNKEFRKCH